MTPREVFEAAIGENLVRMVFSKPKNQDAFSQKMKVRPVVIKEKLVFQTTSAVGSKENNTYKEVHDNFSAGEMLEYIKSSPDEYSQEIVYTKT